ncbi:MAG: AMP-dependent synthetase/ligase [Dehalococcoidia bacterium]
MARNLGELVLEASRSFPNDVAFQVRRGFRLERVTFRQAAESARRVAGFLDARGLAPGDRIAVWSPNMPEYAVLYFGAWLAGIVVVPIDVRTQPDVVQRFVAAARPRLGFMSQHLEGAFGSPVEDTLTLEDLFDRIAEAPPPSKLPEVRPDALCEVAFTSGTTGVPKGVLLTHGNFLAEIAALRTVFPLDRGERAVSVLPLSHAFEQLIGLLLAYTSGARVTYVPRLNAATLGRTLREDQITAAVVVPEMLRLMLTRIERRVRQEGNWGRWQFAHRVAGRLPFFLRRLLFRPVHRELGGHLRFFGCGGAPLDARLAQAWERMGVHIFEGYGLTETSAAATINTRSAHRLGTAGRPIPGVELRIAADGEVLIRGGSVTVGYLDNPDLTVRSFADGWFRTGDVGTIDADGFLRVTGRMAFKIVLPDGRNVYPEDVERALNEHPLVKDSCVVGIERDGGETVHAALLTDAADRAGEIVRETNRRLAAHQQIKGHTVWPEEDFPRTATLKADRKQVRAAVEQAAGRGEQATPAAGRSR